MAEKEAAKTAKLEEATKNQSEKSSDKQETPAANEKLSVQEAKKSPVLSASMTKTELPTNEFVEPQLEKKQCIE